MNEATRNMRARRNIAPLSGWPGLVVLALLTGCGDGASTSEQGCPGPVPAGCACVTGALFCGQITHDADVDPVMGADGSDAAMGGPDLTFDGGLDAVADAGVGDPQTDAAPSEGDAGEVPDGADGSSDAVGFVGEHGALRVQGNRVVDRDGEPIQLRGMSWFWSQWTDFYVAENVDVLVDEWQATLVRAVLGVENDGGYLQNPQANVAKVRTLVDRAIERGIYVIIDWHDHHAQDHEAQATSFFQEMAEAYGDQPHVIFEVYNEPMDVTWPVVKSYAEDLIHTIRAAGSENLIIVGTPTWSQDVDIAANDRITSDDNVAYTLHFYANTHGQFLRDKAKTALDRGIALFVTEWGTCSADGNGSISESESHAWLGFLQEHSISWANWALNNKAEACSAVQPSGASTGPWRDDQLTPSGRLVKSAIP